MGHFEKGRWVKDEPVRCVRFVAPDGGIPMKSGDVGHLEMSIELDRETGIITDASCNFSVEPGDNPEIKEYGTGIVEFVASHEFKRKNELIGNSE